MPIPFTCPYCGLYTLVDDEFAGHAGPCAACGKVISVPFPAAGPNSIRPLPLPAKRSKAITIVFAVVGSLLAGGLVIGILAALLVPAVGIARKAQGKRTCSENLRRINQALRQYHQVNGTFPPAYLTDRSGKPAHSWRVLILPYLDQQTLYNEYDFSEPWDSPRNKLLISRMPNIYACPGDEDAVVLGETSYFVVSGPGTLFPGKTVTTLDQVTDDQAHTLVLVESHLTGVCWMEPKDMDVSRLQFAISEAEGRTLGGNHEGGAQVLMVDGTTMFLSDSTSEDYLQSMSTIQGREVIPWELLDQ